MIPPDMKDEQLPFVLYNLGGSLVNLCASIICFVLYAHFPQMLLVSPLLCLTGSIGVAFALLNGIPMNTGAVDNDGKNACSLGKHPAALHAFWVQMKVNEQLTRGKRLRDMPEEWFLFPAESAMQNSMVATLAVFACNRLSDEGRYEEADAQIERLLAMESGIIGVHRNLLVCDRIWYELTHQNRKEVVERLLTREQRSFMRTMKKFPSVIRTEYALAALFERDTAKAAATLALFERVAKHYPYPSDIEGERELLRLVADKTV